MKRARNLLLALALLVLLLWPVWHLYRTTVSGAEDLERSEPWP